MKRKLFNKLAIRMWQILGEAMPEDVPYYSVFLSNKGEREKELDNKKYYDLKIHIKVPAKQVWKLVWALKAWRVK